MKKKEKKKEKIEFVENEWFRKLPDNAKALVKEGIQGFDTIEKYEKLKLTDGVKDNLYESGIPKKGYSLKIGAISSVLTSCDETMKKLSQKIKDLEISNTLLGNTNEQLVEANNKLETNNLKITEESKKYGMATSAEMKKLDETNTKLTETNQKLEETNTKLIENNKLLENTNKELTIKNKQGSEKETNLTNKIESLEKEKLAWSEEQKTRDSFWKNFFIK